MLDRDLPLKKEIAENIKQLMKERGWTQLKLSEVSKISKSTLSDYINCKTLINPGNVEKLSEAFGVPKYQIDPSFKRSDMKVEESLTDYVVNSFARVPIVGTISCGNGVIAYENIEGYEEIPRSWLNGGEYFLLRANGDSMINARIHEGDLLLIRRQEDVENGEIAAVLIEGEAVLKRVFKTDTALILQSENPKYEPIIVGKQSDIKILGRLQKVVLNF
ncbi:LexA family protein [Siminovitchia fortis]|uniref:LexA family protein n=1 Tax=Siminovitchia fortis TaxID=254758 RepID=UPI0011A5363D|nr:LexA family transcriptional regulator [Siminovitchia fortis]